MKSCKTHALTVYFVIKRKSQRTLLAHIVALPRAFFLAPGRKKCVLGPPNACHKIEKMFKINMNSSSHLDFLPRGPSVFLALLPEWAEAHLG